VAIAILKLAGIMEGRSQVGATPMSRYGTRRGIISMMFRLVLQKVMEPGTSVPTDAPGDLRKKVIMYYIHVVYWL
jgi:hypothetical protein